MALYFRPFLRWDIQPGACPECRKMAGKIVMLWNTFDPAPPLHPNCRCRVRLTLRRGRQPG